MHVSVLPRLKTIDPPRLWPSFGTAGLVYQREECDAKGDGEIRPILTSIN